jgi:regulator of replication initiation timing
MDVHDVTVKVLALEEETRALKLEVEKLREDLRALEHQVRVEAV